MRTTIRIDEKLLKQAKQAAVRRGTSLSAIIEDALARNPWAGRPVFICKPASLVTFDGNGLLPGVVLDDFAALLDVMESAADVAD